MTPAPRKDSGEDGEHDGSGPTTVPAGKEGEGGTTPESRQATARTKTRRAPRAANRGRTTAKSGAKAADWSSPEGIREALGALRGDAFSENLGRAGRRGGTGQNFSGNFIIHEAHFRDAVAGSVYGAGSGAGATDIPGLIPSGRITRLREVFVAPADYDVLRERLREQKLLILRGPAGWGKTAAATMLLDSVGAKQVRRHDPESGLRTLTSASLASDTGHLIDWIGLGHLPDLRSGFLDRLASHLADLDAHMVLTLDGGLPIDTGDLHGHLADCADRATAVQIVRSHLVRIQGTAYDEQRIDAFMAAERVAEVCAKAQDLRLASRRLEWLATHLSGSIEAPDRAADLLGQLDEEATADFRTWFMEGHSVSQRAFTIALAALDELPYPIVAGAARELEARLVQAARQDAGPGHEQEHPESGRPERTVFDVTRTERLATSKAVLKDVVMDGRYGYTTMSFVRFENEQYPAWVLDTLWTEYDDAQPVVMGWLRDLALNDDVDLGVRAGITAGRLAQYEFDWICDEIITPWAGSEDLACRYAAVWALGALAASPGFAGHASALIKEWSADDSPIEFRWVAVRALGAAVGQYNPAGALRSLGLMAVKSWPDLAEPMLLSIGELFTAPADGTVDLVVAKLLRWSESRHSTRREFAALAFLHIAETTFAVDADSGRSWPAMLWLAVNGLPGSGQPVTEPVVSDDGAGSGAGFVMTSRTEVVRRGSDERERIAALWRFAANAPFVATIAPEVLWQWIERADRDQPMTEALRWLFTAEVFADVDRRLLADQLRLWIAEKKTGPVAAAHVLLQDLEPSKETT